MKRPASFISALFLFLVSIGHLLRLLFNVHVVAGGVVVPVWLSLPALIVTGSLGIWLMRERSTAQGGE